jgi:hypothetical protein
MTTHGESEGELAAKISNIVGTDNVFVSVHNCPAGATEGSGMRVAHRGRE